MQENIMAFQKMQIIVNKKRERRFLNTKILDNGIRNQSVSDYLLVLKNKLNRSNYSCIYSCELQGYYINITNEKNNYIFSCIFRFDRLKNNIIDNIYILYNIYKDIINLEDKIENNIKVKLTTINYKNEFYNLIIEKLK